MAWVGLRRSARGARAGRSAEARAQVRRASESAQARGPVQEAFFLLWHPLQSGVGSKAFEKPVPFSELIKTTKKRI